jgi:hypothetical protein
MNKSAAFQRCIYTAEAQRTRNGFFTRRPRRLSGAFSHCRGAEHAEKIFHSAPSASLRCVCFLPPGRRARGTDFLLGVLGVSAVHLHRRGAERAERIFYSASSASQRRIFLPQRRRARRKDFSLCALGISAVRLFFPPGRRARRKDCLPCVLSVSAAHFFTAEAQSARNGFFTRRPRRLSGAFTPQSNCVACQGALVCTAGSQGFC